MPFALELTLDHLAAARVRELWGQLATAGFTFPAESGANPHVSLGIWDRIDHPGMEHAIMSFAMVTPPVDVVFVCVASFTDSGVVFLAPHVDPRLLAVHATVIATSLGSATVRGPTMRSAPGCRIALWPKTSTLGASRMRLLSRSRRTCHFVGASSPLSWWNFVLYVGFWQPVL
jgi:hypothetical protein